MPQEYIHAFMGGAVGTHTLTRTPPQALTTGHATGSRVRARPAVIVARFATEVSVVPLLDCPLIGGA